MELCHEASQFFASKDDRQLAVTNVLSRYLMSNFPRLRIPIGKSGQPPVTDGTATISLSGVRHHPSGLVSFGREILQQDAKKFMG